MSDAARSSEPADRGARRRTLLLGLAGIAATRVAGAQRLVAPRGPTLLTLAGRIARTNAGGEAHFDQTMLAALPALSYATRTPWYPQARTFTGVRLRDVLAAVEAQGQDVRAIALNDYRVEIPASDVNGSDVMVAYLLDDQPMRVREKGPLVVIYPFDARRELRTAVYYSRAAWQLARIEVK
ncbi:MAG: molybdopterin-dependent oxidoreductase [Burkholderiaceae bacterium]